MTLALFLILFGLIFGDMAQEAMNAMDGGTRA
jgi:hypothetical protein